jgi:RND family efflux transporter MFP subunit
VSRSLHLKSLALAGLLSLGACKHAEEAEEAAPLPTVRVVVAKSATLAERIAIAGVLAPLPGRDVKVGALVPGRVERVLVAEGDLVTPGQPLARIEAQPLADRVTEADAQRSNAQAVLENSRTRLERAEKLFRDGIASRQEVDDARAQVVAGESGVKQAQAAGGTAAVNLQRATLRSPIAGIVAAILVPAGAPVDGNATPVIEVADARELDLRAPVPAGRAGRVRVGQKAELTVDGVGAIEGEVVALAPLVDTATNTVTVRVRVHNPAGRLRGGLFARGALLGPAHTGIAVPRSALLPGDGGAASTVAVVRPDGTVELRAIVAGDEAESTVEIASGLSAGDRVVVAGGYSLPAGTKVELAP